MNEIKKDLRFIDIVCIILDARIPYVSNNQQLYALVKNKTILIVLNKSDLADKEKLAQAKEKYIRQGCYVVETVATSAEGIENVVASIRELGKRIQSNKTNAMAKEMKPVYKVLVAGIPNVGKSTVINALSKRKVAITGDKPGVTKQKQWLKCAKDIELMDTPGLLWPNLSSDDAGIKLALTGNIKEEVFDVNVLAFEGLKYILSIPKYTVMLKDRYNLTTVLSSFQPSQVLEQMAISRKYVTSGNCTDFEKISRAFLQDLKHGKIGRISFE